MIVNSLKSRIIAAVTGIVFISLTITALFFGHRSKQALSEAIEGNALSLLEAKKNHVESQYSSILYYKSAMLDRRKIELKNTTAIAFAIINKSYRQFKEGRISEASAKLHAISDVSNLRYDNGVGYFWINDMTRPFPIMMMHPTIPELDGTLLDKPEFNCALGKQENLFKAFVDVCHEQGEGYVDYLWPKPLPEGLTEQQPKISYVKLFEPWNWVIGTGVYTDDIDTDIQRRIDAVIEDLNKTILKQRIGTSGYFFIFNEDNKTLVHPNHAGTDGTQFINPETGKPLFEEFKKCAFTPNQSMEYLWDKPGHNGDYSFSKKVFVTYFEPLSWYICSSVYIDDFQEKISQMTRTVLLFSSVFLIVALIISLLVSNSIITPLKQLITSIQKTDQDGIPTGIIPETGAAEIKVLGSTMNSMISSVSKSREALWKSEAKYRGLIESSSDLIWEMDPDGVFTYVSPRIESVLGYTPETVIGTHRTERMPYDEAKRFTEVFQSVSEKGQPVVTLETINLHRDGSHIVLETSGVPVVDENGTVTGYRGIDRDITMRKQAEEELNHLRNYLSNIINSMPSILIGVDTDGYVTQWNRTAELVTGISSLTAQRKHLSDVYPNLSQEMETIYDSIRTRETKQQKKKQKQAETGTSFEDLTIYPLTSNGIEGAVIRIDDVTELVRMEEIMIQNEKMLSVGGLAAGMAHEINNPLAGMMQTADVMKNRLMNPDMPANRRAADEAGIQMESLSTYMEARGILRMLTTISDSGHRVSEIVNNMLSFARKSDSVTNAHDITELLDKTIELATTDYDLKKNYDFKTIEILREYEPDLPPVPCERGKIQQVLLNILRNGAQAMLDGDNPPRFIIRLAHDTLNGMVRIDIEDNGPGMDEEVRKRVFEPFFTTKPVGIGTGLGLSVSYFIITENHGGTMKVRSEPGKGSTFIIQLPVNTKDIHHENNSDT